MVLSLLRDQPGSDRGEGLHQLFELRDGLRLRMVNDDREPPFAGRRKLVALVEDHRRHVQLQCRRRRVSTLRLSLDRQADVLQVAPDLAVSNLDDADRRLANLPRETRVGPFANNDYGVAFRHEPLDLKPHVRGARHGLAAEEDESLPTEDRLRAPRRFGGHGRGARHGLAAEEYESLPTEDRLGHPGRSVDDVRMQPLGKAIPVPRAKRIEGRRDDLRGRGHERWKRWRANSRAPTRATRPAATAASLARPIIGWCSGHA